jgi:hypothetical protein
MSDHPTLPYPDFEVPAPDVDGDRLPSAGGVAGDAPPEPVAFDDPDSEWMIEDQHKDVRLRIPTAVLVVLLIAAVGFWGGAALQKHHGSTGAVAGSASARAAFANASGRSGFGAQAAGGFSGTAGAATAAGAATTGLVTEVQGNTVYVTDDTGALVKVTVNASSSIRRTSSGLDGGLQTGDTVIVRGAKAADGTITATSIIATAKGAQGSSPGASVAGGAGAQGGGAGGSPAGGGQQ